MIRYSKPALTVVLALGAASCGVDAQQQLADARQAFQRHDYEAAQHLAAAVLVTEPANANALDISLRASLLAADPDTAASALERLVKLGKAPRDMPLLQGEIALQRGQFDRALAAVGKLDTAEAQRIKASAYLGKQDLAAAQAAFAGGERASGPKGRLLADYAHFALVRGDLAEAKRLAAMAEREPSRAASSYLVNADILAAEGLPGKALAAFEAAQAAYPGNRAALLGRIRMLETLGETEPMRPLIAQGLAQDKDDATFIFLDARLDALAGRWDDVRRTLQDHEDLLARDTDTNALYAKALAELGMDEQARSRLSSQLLRAPSDLRTRVLLGELKLKERDGAGAAEVLRPLAQSAAAGPGELRLLAQALKLAGDPQADAVAARAREAVAREVLLGLAAADKAMQAKDWRAAIHRYAGVAAMTGGGNALVLNNMAFAYSESGNLDKALELAERAYKQAPDNASVMDTLGWVLHRAGKDKARAVELLRSAAAKDPANPSIARHLAAAQRT